MTLEQTLIQGLAASIETVINTALRYDPSSRQKLSQIDEVLAVTVTSSPKLSLYLRGHEEGVAVLYYCETPVSAHLQGSALALLTLFKQPTNLAGSGVTLIGSTTLLQQWQHILHKLDIDWEDAISQSIGDIAGPLMASGIRKSAQEQPRLMTEYLQEELKLTPSPPEAEHFYQAIGHLKLDVDRVSARIKKIRQTWHQYTASTSKEDVE